MAAQLATNVDTKFREQLTKLRPELFYETGLPLPSNHLIGLNPEVRHEVIDIARKWVTERDMLAPQTGAEHEASGIAADTSILSKSFDFLSFTQMELAHQETDPDLVSAPITLWLKNLFNPAEPIANRYQVCAQGFLDLHQFLVAGRQEVLSPDPILIERAKLIAACSLRFLNDLGQRAEAISSHTLPQNVAQDFQKAALVAKEAVSEQQQWLSQLQPIVGSATVGPEMLQEILQKRYIELDVDALKDLARTQIEAMRMEESRIRNRAFAKIQAQDLWSEVCAQEAPLSAEEVTAWLEELTEQIAAFTLECGQFPFLSEDQVHIETVPHSVGEIIGATLLSRPRYSFSKVSTLLIPEPVDEASLQNLCVAQLERLAAAQFYPGAHLFGMGCGREASLACAGIPIGFLGNVAHLWGSDLREGWTHYAEETMRELQFRDSPSSRLMITRQVKLNAMHAWYDLAIHTKTISPEEAVASFQIHGGLSKSQAQNRITSVLRSPTQAINYIYGKSKLQSLKREALKKWKLSFSDQNFHSFVLKNGPIPLSMMKPRLENYSVFTANESTQGHQLQTGASSS